VVLAGGGKESLLEIPGKANGKVLTSHELHRRVKPLLRLLGPGMMEHFSRLWLPVGRRVLIIGGKMQGCEAAEFLVRRGRQVTIVEETGQLGEGIAEFPNRKMLVNWLLKKGVRVFIGVKYREINNRGLVLMTEDDREQTIEADTILVALPQQPDRDLFRALQGKVPEVHLIGDARQPGLIGEALANALQIGRSI
jgi:2,4-dienoyl-CoA reductase (NADPH2)